VEGDEIFFTKELEGMSAEGLMCRSIHCHVTSMVSKRRPLWLELSMRCHRLEGEANWYCIVIAASNRGS